MNYNKLSADPIALILAIVSLVLGFLGCCCYGILAFIPLILSIIGLVLANNSLKEYYQNQEVFSLQSKNNVDLAKILNIVSIVINGIIFLFGIIVLLFYGTIITSSVLNGIQQKDNFENLEYQLDSVNTTHEFQEEKNNKIDTTQIKYR
ncbi:CCC motif membrane protein [Flavobacterium sp. J27]|uniref:CCC motif membrane protein n=1 Tax=Flavobacterium sp. J27 TaxID=2060419 RepID=UPI001031ACB0|nr:CCC motif membrane protein [Flavobacterium sp. J27]